jgi:small subunit ribosomal protein S21
VHPGARTRPGQRVAQPRPSNGYARLLSRLANVGAARTERAPNGISSKVSNIILGWGVMRLAEVRLQEGESIENALRRFKRKVQTEDIIKEVKRHSFYLKPGAKRRVKEALARKRARKKVRKESD